MAAFSKRWMCSGRFCCRSRSLWWSRRKTTWRPSHWSVCAASTLSACRWRSCARACPKRPWLTRLVMVVACFGYSTLCVPVFTSGPPDSWALLDTSIIVGGWVCKWGCETWTFIITDQSLSCHWIIFEVVRKLKIFISWAANVPNRPGVSHLYVLLLVGIPIAGDTILLVAALLQLPWLYFDNSLIYYGVDYKWKARCDFKESVPIGWTRLK